MINNNKCEELQTDTSGIGYGYMIVRGFDHKWYSKILSTSSDYSIVASHLRNKLINDINYKHVYVFYETINANPSLITFNVLQTSNFAWCCIERSSKYLYAIPESYIGNLLYNQLDFLIDYIEYKTMLSKLSKSEIALEYKQVFSTSRLMGVKKWMIGDLLVKKQKNIKLMYTNII